MLKTRKLHRVVAATAAATLLLAACGGDDEADPEATTEDTASETEAEPTEEDTGSEEEMTEGEEEMTESEDEMTEGEEEMTEDEGDSALSMEPFGEACSAIPTDGEGSSEGMADDPVATAASNNPVLSTLVQAVTAADLVDTLNTTEDLTVFAPYNDAFGAFSEEELNALLEDTEQLTTVLTLHVAGGGSMDAAALGEAGTVETLQGSELTIEGDMEAGVTVSGPSNSANVICGDVQTANATVHIIDTVLMP